MALDTVQNYIDRARVLLQDTVAPYRYPDADLTAALSLAVLEARRLRPDVLQPFFRTSLPDFIGQSTSTAVPIDPQYRIAFLYYIIGHAQMRDDENDQDSRAAVFLNKFLSQMLSIQA